MSKIISKRISKRLGPPIKNPGPIYMFPEKGDYEVFSNPTFFIKSGEKGELLEMKARLVLEVSDVKMNKKINRRQVSFNIKEWEAKGKSDLIGKVEFKSVKGKNSYVIAGNEKTDLPGKMVIALDADVYLNDEKIIEEHYAEVTGLISEFPPAPGDFFDIRTKDFVFGDIQIIGTHCACPARVV